MPLRIALLTESLSPDRGWGRYAAELVRRLPRRGFDVTVVEIDALSVRRFPWHQREPFLSADHVFRLLQQAATARARVATSDIVHALTERLVPLAATVSWRRPYLFNAYGTFATRPLCQRLRRPVAARLYRRAARIACISRYTEARLRRLLPEACTVVVPSGVDFAKFQVGRVTDDEGDGPVILSVGAVKPRKGYHVLLEALARVRRVVPSVSWNIAGAADFPDYHRRLQARAAELGVAGAVTFLGRVEAPALLREYHRCAVFVLPSINVGDAYEGYPLVFAEAGACGKPVLGTYDNGSEEAILDGVTGLLVAQGDVEATADALIRLLTDRDLACRLGAQGRARARELTWERTTECFAAIYGELAGAVV